MTAFATGLASDLVSTFGGVALCALALEFAAQHVDSYTLEVRIDDELMKLPAVAEMKQRFDEIEGRTSGEGLYRDKMVLPEESPEEYSKFFPKIKQKRQQ